MPSLLVEVAEERAAARTVRQWLAFHKDNPRSIVACIDRARTAARQVRERISSEMWESLNSLHLFLSNPALPDVAETNPHAFFQRVRNEAQLIQGLADATLAHDECWHFVRLGTFLERADNVAHTSGAPGHLLRDDGRNEADMVRWISVLRSCGAAEAYCALLLAARRAGARRGVPAPQPAVPAERAVQPPAGVEGPARAERGRRGPPIPRHAASAATRALGFSTAQLEHAAVDEIIESGLQSYLNDVQRDLARVTDHVTRDLPARRAARGPARRRRARDPIDGRATAAGDGSES